MEVEAIDRYAQEIVDHSQDQYRVGIDEKKIPKDAVQYWNSLKDYYRLILKKKPDNEVIKAHVGKIEGIIKKKNLHVEDAKETRIQDTLSAINEVKILLWKLQDSWMTRQFEKTKYVNLNHTDRTAVDNTKWDPWSLSMLQVGLVLYWGLSFLWWAANLVAWNIEVGAKGIIKAYVTGKIFSTQMYWLDIPLPPEWSAARKIIDMKGADPNDEETLLWKWYNLLISPADEWIESKQNQRAEFLVNHLNWDLVYSWVILDKIKYMTKDNLSENLSDILVNEDKTYQKSPNRLSNDEIITLLKIVFLESWVNSKTEFAETFSYLSRRYNKSLWLNAAEHTGKEWVDASGVKHKGKDEMGGLSASIPEAAPEAAAESFKDESLVAPTEVENSIITDIPEFKDVWPQLRMSDMPRSQNKAPEAAEITWENFNFDRYKAVIASMQSSGPNKYLDDNVKIWIKNKESPEKWAFWKYQFTIATLRTLDVNTIKFTENVNPNKYNHELEKNIINFRQWKFFTDTQQEQAMEEYTKRNFILLGRMWVFKDIEKSWYTIEQVLAAAHFAWVDKILDAWKIQLTDKKGGDIKDKLKTTVKKFIGDFAKTWKATPAIIYPKKVEKNT